MNSMAFTVLTSLLLASNAQESRLAIGIKYFEIETISSQNIDFDDMFIETKVRGSVDNYEDNSPEFKVDATKTYNFGYVLGNFYPDDEFMIYDDIQLTLYEDRLGPINKKWQEGEKLDIEQLWNQHEDHRFTIQYDLGFGLSAKLVIELVNDGNPPF
eukprot:CAMPEP_0201575836 /NCGR_PEP_ID=MMETSP0190_2-20130828/21254_1 /ASSEMBLY_ACC=CAM_ASM_000263 /TAXON_ID=37353 /ORGANISM="Rosalina sp." /LENGTH=156 /DNA_ID=CAMNT_0048005953 /DNA_START=248 /DNA_END=718 /DNA_ORIENTATION=+